MGRAFRAIGFADSAHTIVQAEFVRTLLAPTVVAVLTGASGIYGEIPLMWVIMASSVAFGGAMTGMLRGSEYIQRKNPLDKMRYMETSFLCDLRPAPLPMASNAQANRQQRRAASSQKARKQPQRILRSSEISVGVNRELDKCVIGITVKNEASFPISCLMYMARTEMEGLTPPRTEFPKDKMTILPGASVTFRDAKIDMQGKPCGRLSGNMDIWLKYGLPGKEHFDLKFKATLDIQLEPFGLVVAVHTKWID